MIAIGHLAWRDARRPRPVGADELEAFARAIEPAFHEDPHPADIALDAR